MASRCAGNAGSPKTLSPKAQLCSVNPEFCFHFNVSVLRVRGRQGMAEGKQGMARECLYASAALTCPQQEENEACGKRKDLTRLWKSI